MTRPLTIAASLAAVMALASLPHSALAQDATRTTEPVATETAAPAPATPATASPAALVGNADNGRVLTYTCLGCHGIVGYRNVYPTYHVPMIGGQSAVYLTTALTEYRRGTRKHPTMQVQAQGFSDQDIADIAAFLSELKP